MRLRRALHLVGTGALTGALLLGSAPTASADDIRDREWALDFFAAQDIWEHATGKGVTVAVVDTGVDASFPDLKGRVLKGKDFSKGGNDAQEDNAGHGTGMAGLIAGTGHGPGNKSGVMGLAPGAKILPLKVSDDDAGYGVSTEDAIRYAADHGAKVINVSLGGSVYDDREREAIDYARKKDAIVVAGTGNSGTRNKEYPAAYPGVVAVGGLDKSGTVWENSNWGKQTALIAPATQNVVASTDSASGYAMADGTSNAAAYTSATIALVREKHPELTPGQILNRIVKTALPVAPKGSKPKLPSQKYGYGVIRPFRAVTYDIPAGPKAGPLAPPEKSSDSAAGAGSSDSGSSSSDGSSGWMFALGPPIVLFGLIFLVLVGIAVVVVVFVKRRDSRDRVSDPWGSGGGPTVPSQYPGQQYQAPTGQFGGPPNSPPPPPPNQPPS